MTAEGESQAAFFADCCSLLSQEAADRTGAREVRELGLPSDREAPVRAFLAALDYLEEADGRHSPGPDRKSLLANRLTLLSFAGRLERIFRLPCRQAPSVVLVGGEVAPERFGLRAPDNPVEGVGGKGLSFRSAFESCLGEAAEYLSFLSWGDEPLFHASARDLQFDVKSGGRPFADPGAVLSWLAGGVGLAPEALAEPRDWVEARSLQGHRCLPVPAALCYRRAVPPGEALPRKAESNGCAAGPDLASARLSALLEVIERDALALWWHGGRRAAALRLSPDSQAELEAFMASFRAESNRPCRFLDLTHDLGIPVIAALSSDGSGDGVIGGFGAGPDPLQAARKAALELCQMELALDLVRMKVEQRGPDALNDADHRQLERAARLRFDGFPQFQAGEPSGALASTGPTGVQEALRFCLDRLAAAGFEAFTLDLTRPALGLPVARVLVPGLQSAKVDWLTQRLRTTASENGLSPASWRDLPGII